MSLSDVQARTQALDSRLQALSGRPAALRGLAGGPIGATAAGTAAGVSFTAALNQATSAPSATTAGSPVGDQAVNLASQQIGTPYVFGGEQPGGFDCSGLMQWTYHQLGVELPRVASQQGKAGTEVSAAEARPGDLVYFDHSGPVDHIGMYAGNGMWVVAPHTGAKVRLEKVDLSQATSIRRVTPQQGGPTTTPTTTPTGTAGWARALPAAGQKYAGMIAQAAEKTGVDPRLLSAVAWTESDFDPSAVSGAGAQGLMQIMPQTAAGLGVNALDPGQALQGGARYLSQQLTAFGGRPDLALAAYNAGPTAVRKAGGVPPYAETQKYVKTVLDRYRQLGGTA